MLSYDICRCLNEKCELRKCCARWVYRETGGHWTAYAAFGHHSGGKGCDYMISALPGDEAEVERWKKEHAEADA